MVDWPATLPPYPNRNGFERRPRPNVVAFGTEVGPGKRRRRSTARTELWSLQFFMTAAQVVIFEAFFQGTLTDGALPFNWVYPMTAATWTFHFDVTAPYTITSVNPTEYLVSLSLEGALAIA